MNDPRNPRDSMRRLGHRAMAGRMTLAALAATGILAAADLALTVHVASTHGLLEINPVARALAAGAGTPGIIAFKVLTVSLGLWVLARARRRALARIASVGVLVAHCWMMSQWSGYMDAMRVVHETGHTFTQEHSRLAMNL